MNLKDIENFHFVGIGGIGMSGLARLLKASGKNITGSDSTKTKLTETLEKEGIRVTYEKADLPEGTELLVYSEAVPENDHQRSLAKAANIPQLNYFEALGLFSKNYKTVAVAGTHGKTTTVAMLGQILIEAGLDPSILIGSTASYLQNKNARLGGGEIFVVEACEYRRNFLHLQPSLLGITNMEADHLDYYKDEKDYFLAFEQLSSKSKTIIKTKDYESYQGELKVFGDYNRENAGLAAALARRLGASEQAIEKGLQNFTGTWRRMEARGELNGAKVYDDYAHHPTEILASLKAFKENFTGKRIVVVFEPHQYSRTWHLLDGFSQSFSDADLIIIPSIYEVRDSKKDKEKISPQKLADSIDGAIFIDGYKKTASYLKESITENDALLIMGAGPVDSIITLFES